jgi:hypothetical protein
LLLEKEEENNDDATTGGGCEGCEGIREAYNDSKVAEKGDISRGNTSNSDNKDQNIGGESSVEPSQPSHDPNVENERHRNLLLKQGAYWSGSKWHCKSCKYSYDGPGMIEHLRLEHSQ